MQTVQLLKLVSGEELLGRVSCDDNAVYTITMPVTIVQDESNMGFEPFMPYSDSDSFEISGDKVILAANPTVSLKDYYINATTPAETESVIDLSATSGIVV
jgi:hypothetical protein|tara:strand:- start:1341 stop:1643 length:303 start_codon:yes stop_codon:yes gene_type:complete